MGTRPNQTRPDQTGPDQTYKTKHTKPNLPPQPTQRRNLTYQCFCTKNKKVDQSNIKTFTSVTKSTKQNKTKHNSIFSKCKKVNQLMHFIFTKSKNSDATGRDLDIVASSELPLPSPMQYIQAI